MLSEASTEEGRQASGQKGSLRALINKVGTSILVSHGLLDAVVQ